MSTQQFGRRDFLKLMSAGSAVFGVEVTMAFAKTTGREDFGLCKSVRVTCVSETGWIDGQRLLKDMEAVGGPKTNQSQWGVDWDPDNSGGCCNLVELELLDGTRRRFLLDTGWNNEYMERAYRREGIDRALARREIDFLYVSHEHFDHFFGLETTLRYDPSIKILVPGTFRDEGREFLDGAEFLKAKARNRIPRRGELVRLEPGRVHRLYPGCATVTFDVPIPFGVRGEQSLYFNVKDRGLVCVTGCCHQKVINYLDFAQARLAGGDNFYGLYGGLHIAPVGPLDGEGEHTVKAMAKYNFKKLACNHCTGISAVQKMVELGYPVVRGTARHGSTSNLYLGNGDEIVFA